MNNWRDAVREALNSKHGLNGNARLYALKEGTSGLAKGVQEIDSNVSPRLGV